MTKHVADQRKSSNGGRVKHFLRLARAERATWHRPRAAAGASRLAQFLRILRGREV
jgi:hypothetical protein